MKPVRPRPISEPTLSRRQLLLALGMGGLATSPATHPQSWFKQITQALKGNPVNAYTTEKFKWDLTFCSYGLDLDPKGQGDLETVTKDNWFKDADGNVVARFFTGFGAAWGAGTTGMGRSTSDKGARLPKTFCITYYDFLEDRFYQVKGELPQSRIYELFKPRTIDKDVEYGRVIPIFDELRIGVAPFGNVMIWAAGNDQVELQTYHGQVVMQGVTRQSYNASLPGGTFTLMEDRDKVLLGGRMKPETLARIKAGWVPDPTWYMRTIRVKYPWRHRLTGNVTRMTELESYQGNGEAHTIGAWEMALYESTTAMRGVPDTAKFWFHDRTGTRHHLWISFSLRERALSESDLSEVRAAFEKMFPGRTMDDNAYAPQEQDMATVEVNIGDDFKTFTASLVKGEIRIPLPVGRTQHFVLEPYTHWPGQKTSELKPGVQKLFLLGPDA